MKTITITLDVDGSVTTRIYKAHEVEHIDWNAPINDMADSLKKADSPLPIFFHD